MKQHILISVLIATLSATSVSLLLVDKRDTKLSPVKPKTHFQQLAEIPTTTSVQPTTTQPAVQKIRATQNTTTTTTTQPVQLYCQYPDRWSNPPGGCDNTDPAVPECLEHSYSREAEEACIRDYELRHLEVEETL